MKNKEHPCKMQYYESSHCRERRIERGVENTSIEYDLGHFTAEYGYKDHPNAEPRPLSKPNRRAFLVQLRGVQGVLTLWDASDTKVVKVTVIPPPFIEWGPLPKKYLHYTRAGGSKS